MKYTISINQLANYEKGLGLDLIDLALFDFVISFVHSGRCECISMDNKPYFWISPQHIIEEMPILGITTTRGINLRIDHLIAAGMLLRGPENQSKRRTYLAFGPKVGDYEFSTWNGDSNQVGTSVPRINNINDNININNNICAESKNESSCEMESLFDGTDSPLDKMTNGTDCREGMGAISNKHQTKESGNSTAASKEELMKKREQGFRYECYKYVGEFGAQMVEDFILYWTEPNKSKSAMRFELERTWDTHRRMLTWSKNNFRKYNCQEVAESHKEISATEALKRAGWI